MGLCCLPVLVLIASEFVTHVLFPRYAIEFLAGVSAIIGIGLWMVCGGQRVPAVLMALVLAANFFRTAHGDFRADQEYRLFPFASRALNQVPKAAEADQLPIAASNLHDFMRVIYYGDAAFRRRLVYVSSEKYAMQVMGETNAERMMIGSAPYFHTPVVNYSAFVKAYPKFYVLGASNWLIPTLLSQGANIRLMQRVDAPGNVPQHQGSTEGGPEPLLLVNYEHKLGSQ